MAWDTEASSATREAPTSASLDWLVPMLCTCASTSSCNTRRNQRSNMPTKQAHAPPATTISAVILLLLDHKSSIAKRLSTATLSVPTCRQPSLMERSATGFGKGSKCANHSGARPATSSVFFSRSNSVFSSGPSSRMAENCPVSNKAAINNSRVTGSWAAG